MIIIAHNEEEGGWGGGGERQGKGGVGWGWGRSVPKLDTPRREKAAPQRGGELPVAAALPRRLLEGGGGGGGVSYKAGEGGGGGRGGGVEFQPSSPFFGCISSGGVCVCVRAPTPEGAKKYLHSCGNTIFFLLRPNPIKTLSLSLSLSLLTPISSSPLFLYKFFSCFARSDVSNKPVLLCFLLPSPPPSPPPSTAHVVHTHKGELPGRQSKKQKTKNTRQ